MHPFSTLWKHQKTVWSSYVFSWYRKGALGTNGRIFWYLKISRPFRSLQKKVYRVIPFFGSLGSIGYTRDEVVLYVDWSRETSFDVGFPHVRKQMQHSSVQAWNWMVNLFDLGRRLVLVTHRSYRGCSWQIELGIDGVRLGIYFLQ